MDCLPGEIAFEDFLFAIIMMISAVVSGINQDEIAYIDRSLKVHAFIKIETNTIMETLGHYFLISMTKKIRMPGKSAWL